MFILLFRREYVELTSITDVTNLPSTSSSITTISSADDQPSSSTIISSDDESSASTVVPSDDESPTDSQNDTRCIGRDFAPMFFVLAIFFALILLGFVSTLCNRRDALFRGIQRRNTNSVYSQLTSANEFDLN